MTDIVKKPAKWRNWVLIASLALNLAIIGLVAGSALRGPRAEGAKSPPPDMLRELVRAIPKSHREDLRADLGAKQEDMRAFRRQMRDKRQELVTVLESPEFDMSGVVAIFEDHRVILSRITAGGHEIIIKRIERMSEAERQDFARNIQTLREKRRKPR